VFVDGSPAACYPVDGCRKQFRNTTETRRYRAKMSGIRRSLGGPGGEGQIATDIDKFTADH